MKRSVVLHDTRIRSGAQVIEAILDKQVVVGENAVLGTGSAEVPNKETPDHLFSGLIVVGKEATIPPNFTIGKNSILHPHIREQDFASAEIPEGETIRASQIKE